MPFSSLNLGRALGDSAENVRENHDRLAHDVGYPTAALFELSQVHGCRVREVETGEDPSVVRQEDGDALLSLSPERVVGVRTADCVPILLADPDSGAVAAVHSGWRGTVAGVLPAALGVLCSRTQAAPERLLAAIGPHIRVEHFEVGPEVAAEIQAVSPDTPVVDNSYERPHVDLTKVILSQLQGFGLLRENVDDIGGCTYAESTLYFSYRRDGARSGRHLSVIVPR